MVRWLRGITSALSSLRARGQDEISSLRKVRPVLMRTLTSSWIGSSIVQESGLWEIRDSTSGMLTAPDWFAIDRVSEMWNKTVPSYPLQSLIGMSLALHTLPHLSFSRLRPSPCYVSFPTDTGGATCFQADKSFISGESGLATDKTSPLTFTR